MNQITWAKPDPPPHALHTAFTHAHETLLWASKRRGSRHTFNYDLINSRDPRAQVSSVWSILRCPRGRSSTATIPPRNPRASCAAP
jgi:site-specific DNA-methyltransferase (adenine-specific)